MINILKNMTLFSFFVLCCHLELYGQYQPTLNCFETFFSYSPQALQELYAIPPSREKLTREKFERWDPIVYNLTTAHRPDGQSTCVMAYLYAAQRDFALLSHKISQNWIGQPDQLIVKTINLFYPEYRPTQPVLEDEYSSKISDLIFRKIKDRYKNEQANLHYYPERKGLHYWKEKIPYYGQRIGSCKLWLLKSLNEVKAAQPPGIHSIIWDYGIHEIYSDQKQLTPEQKQLIFYWAGKEGPESGNWFAIMNNTLNKKSLPLVDFLLVRAAFSMAYTDSMIACFDSKYTYWVKRPHMMNPNVIQLITCPIHPSYPSGHSATSATASTILSHFFPEDRETFQNLAIQSGNSRIWAGIHFMYDNEQGLIQGEKVGRAIAKYLPHLSQDTNSSPENLKAQINVLSTK